MANKKTNQEIAFIVAIEDLQRESLRIIGRRLTDEELYTAKKGIEAGLMFDIDTVLGTAVKEAVS